MTRRALTISASDDAPGPARPRRDASRAILAPGPAGSRALAGRGLLAAALVLSTIFAAPPASAQTTSAVLKGTVRTPSGQPVADAVVQARSDATGVVRTALTSAEGRYRFDLLPPGEWTIVARAIDGGTSEGRSIRLTLQQSAEIDLTVAAALTEKVTVKAEAPGVDPQKVGSALRVGGRLVEALPIAGRNVTDLALLDSTVQASAPNGFFGEKGTVFVVNGQSGRANSFLVDGLDNNDPVSGTTLSAFFSQQVIREFVLLTHQFAPEFGRASGGVMNILTERGTNEATGEVFLQGAAEGWNDPGEFIASLPRRANGQDATSRAQTGFKLGGPLRKDRAFYFLAYEHQRASVVTPFTGVDRTGIAGGWVVAPSRDDNLFFKTDFNLSANHLLMVRLSADDSEISGLNVAGNTTPEAGFELKDRDIQLAGSLTSVLSPHLLNEARILVGKSDFEQRASSGRPGVDRPSGSFGGSSLNSQLRDESRFQIVDNLTWQLGAQTVKVGVDVTRSRTKVRVRFNPNGNFLYNSDAPFEPGDCGDIINSQVSAHCSNDPGQSCRGDSDCPNVGGREGICLFEPVDCPGSEDLDMDGTFDEPGRLDSYPIVFSLIEGRPEATLDDTRFALFAQSSWQVSPRLLLDYGWRYDVSTFRLPARTRVPSVVPNGGAKRDLDNLAPRIGFSWTPMADGRLVVSGGGGIFYDKLVLGFPAVAAITSGTRIGLLFPQGLTLEINEKVVEEIGIDVLKQGLFFPPELTLRFSTGTRLDTPYAVEYKLGADLATGTRSALRAEAQRVLGYHQALLRDLNPPIGTDPQGIPVHQHDHTVGSIAAVVTEGRSWYTGLDLGWRWRGESSGWSVSYTWSKALDLGFDPLKGGISLPPDSNDIGGEKGRSDSDRRHRGVVAGEGRLPWLGLRLSGVFQASTGAPFNVTTGKDGNLDGLANDRPRGVGRNTGEDTPLGPINRLRDLYGLPRVGRPREPSFVQLDLRIAKPLALEKEGVDVGGRGGHARAEIFAQVFNVLDRFNAGPIEGRVSSRRFGKPLGQLGPPRTFELGLKAGF